MNIWWWQGRPAAGAPGLGMVVCKNDRRL
eukprot:COSAG06_NODE_39551_length_411_cov_0.887821_1_plen_28_part_01